jgi:hypothetical protein
MSEDQDRSRLGNSQNNLAVLQGMVFNVMPKENATKTSPCGKL